MNKILFVFVLFCFSSQFSFAQAKPAMQKPNIILILTDDLGYGDLGAFYQNIRKSRADQAEPWMQTPHLDQLAASGAILTNSYCAAPVCAPSRASMLLGVSQGHANVRDNQFDKALEANYNIANVLKSAGYSTAVIGKWGLQGLDKNWPAHPLNRGFDYFFGYMRHSDGHEHYPKEGLYRKSKQVWENRKEISNALAKCYTGDLFTAVAKKWIVQQHEKNGAQPFFLFLSFDNPHAVLELPTQKYPANGGLKGGMQWLGKPGEMINTANGTIDSYVHPDYANATYDDDHNPSTPPVPWPDTYKRYATIVRRIDDQVGDLIQLLKDLNSYDHTLIVFTSDNGPSIESYLPKNFVPNHPNFFNSFGPFDGIKRDVWEGGMRTPTIVAWPSMIKPNAVVTEPNISYDFLPTFAQAAGLTAPARTNGISLLPLLTNQKATTNRLIYSEYFEKGATPNFDEFDKSHRNRKRNQMQLIRIGDTLAVRYNITHADDDFEIYAINKDQQETNNLAKNHQLASLQEELKAKVLQLRIADTTAKRPYDTTAIPGLKLKHVMEGMNWKSYMVNSIWIPTTATLTIVKSGVVSDAALQSVKVNGENLVVYNGYFLAATDGVYHFELSANGKAFLKVHDINLIDEDFNYSSGQLKSGDLHLKAGYHPITLFCLMKKGAVKPDFKFMVSNPKKERVNTFYR